MTAPFAALTTIASMNDPRPSESRQAVQRHILATPAPFSLRAAGEGGGGIGFTGHGIVYDRWTEIYDYWFGAYQERIAPGAATAHLQDDVRLLINHDANLLLARTTSGTMRLSEDATGVIADAEMAPTQYARDLAVLLERGDISQMSFSFIPGDEEWDMRRDGTWLRTITSFEALYDMSIVTYPAYEETDAGLRAKRHGGPRIEPVIKPAERSSLELQVEKFGHLPALTGR